MDKDAGGPAFPLSAVQDFEGVYHRADAYIDVGGMTLRDYFAAKAMTGFLLNASEFESGEQMAADSYTLADAMIKAREQSNG